MKNKKLLLAALTVVLCPFGHSVVGQTKSESQPTVQTVIQVVDLSGIKSNELIRFTGDAKWVAGAVTAGKAKVVADLTIVQRSGRPGLIRSGRRVPIQTSSLPFTSAPPRPVPHPVPQPPQPEPRPLRELGGAVVGMPQIQYENVGMTAEVIPAVEADGAISLRLSLELSSVSSNGSTLTPSFLTRVMKNEITVKPDEPSLLALDVVPDPSFLSGGGSEGPDKAGASKVSGDNFVVLVTAKVLDR